jgi:uncharacterized protein (TIGR02996 family)
MRGKYQDLETAFLEAIREAPQDDTPRLVYADWLDDQGEHERAEFIRVQCELAQMAVFNDYRRELQGRQRQLLARHGAKWLTQEWPEATNPVVDMRTFERGFVADLSLSGRDLGDKGVRALARSPRLALLAALDLRNNRVGPSGVRALAASPFLAGLRLLDLRWNLFDADSVRVLAASPHLSQLRELVVSVGSRLAELQTWGAAVHSG